MIHAWCGAYLFSSLSGAKYCSMGLFPLQCDQRVAGSHRFVSVINIFGCLQVKFTSVFSMYQPVTSLVFFIQFGSICTTFTRSCLVRWPASPDSRLHASSASPCLGMAVKQLQCDSLALSMRKHCIRIIHHFPCLVALYISDHS